MMPTLAHGGSAFAWTFDPLQLATIAAAALLYARRASTLARRGRPVPALRRASFYGGLVLVAAALVSPLHHLGEERLFAAHMLQHVLIGDAAALLLVAGLTGPLLRPLLALRAVGRLRVLAHPLLALPLWAANLYLWHVPSLYQAALASEPLHALQHVLFLVTGALIWAAVVEPLPGPAWFGTGWKAVYVLTVRLLVLVLGNLFLFAGRVFYPRYAEAERTWGLTPLEDQNLAGVVMLADGSMVTLVLFAWLFTRWLGESEARQELVERGHDPAKAGRAARYGRSVSEPGGKGMGAPRA